MHFKTPVCPFLLYLLLKGFMFRALVLVCGCLLQRMLVTTEGHHGTNRLVFYTVQMDGGTKAARALAEQHRLEFIQRVCICLKCCYYLHLWAFSYKIRQMKVCVCVFFFLRAAKVLTSVCHLSNI